jgi:hypothetical protein
MVEKNVMEHATNVTAGLGIVQYFLPAANTALQTIFLIASIAWVLTQLYFRWFKHPNKDN